MNINHNDIYLVNTLLSNDINLFDVSLYKIFIPKGIYHHHIIITQDGNIQYMIKNSSVSNYTAPNAQYPQQFTFSDSGNYIDIQNSNYGNGNCSYSGITMMPNSLSGTNHYKWGIGTECFVKSSQSSVIRDTN